MCTKHRKNFKINANRHLLITWRPVWNEFYKICIFFILVLSISSVQLIVDLCWLIDTILIRLSNNAININKIWTSTSVTKMVNI